MPKRKAKYIDKRSAVTWHLFDRAQNDIMCGDAAMPQVAMVEVERSQRLKERRKFGIYYEDDYDYMRHLKPRSGAPLVVAADGDGEGDDGESDFWEEGGAAGEDDGESARHPPASTAAASAGGFALPAELLPNEPAAGVGDVGDDDADFFDPEIAEAIAAAEAAGGEGDGDIDEASDEDADGDADLAEAIEEGDIEDDFVALANAPDVGGDAGRRPLVGAGAAAASKRDIFSRFFEEDPDYDDHADDEEAAAGAADPSADRASVATSRRGRPLTYHEEVIEDQFDRLLREFQRDSADAAGCDDREEPGAVDDDCGSVMTKSQYQVLESHAKELASEAVTLRDLDAGRLPAEDALRALATMDIAADGSDADSDASSLDTEDELRLWGPAAAAAAPKKLTSAAAAAASDGRSRRNMPTLLDAGERQRDAAADTDTDDDDDDEEEAADAAGATPSSAETLRAKLAGVADKRERKRLVKEHQRARREQKKQTRLCFGKARAELQCAVRNDPFQQGRVVKL